MVHRASDHRDIESPRYALPTRLLDGVVHVAGSTSLLFAALAALAVAVEAAAERSRGAFVTASAGAVLFLLGTLNLALDRDPGGEFFVDRTLTRPGGPLTIIGLVLVALLGIWLARRPQVSVDGARRFEG